MTFYIFMIIPLSIAASYGIIVTYLLQRSFNDNKLREEELKKARIEAQAASHAKSEFLAGISHEIRTPMNVIIGMGNLLQETSLTSEQQEYVTILRSSGENLISIINDTLDISKVDAGHFKLEETNFDLDNLLKKICKDTSAKAHKKGLDLFCHSAPDIPTGLVGDPGRLRRILLNLIENAIKFTEKGTIMLEVKRHSSEPKEERPDDNDTKDKYIKLIFSVTDTGIGIESDKIEEIFDVFMQADSSSTRRHPGMGLGLAISKRLVELMNGKIWIKSTVNQGSTFFFTAQFKVITSFDQKKNSHYYQEGKIQEPASLDGIKTIREQTELTHNKQRIKILLAEDYKNNQLLIKSYLKKTLYDLDIAENGEIAVRKFKANNYDLVLMDIEMPIMDGITATRIIREWEQKEGLTATPIIVLTAYATQEDEQKSLHAGADKHLTKPIKKEKLLETIYNYSSFRKGAFMNEDQTIKQNNKIIIHADPDLEDLIPEYLADIRNDADVLLASLAKGDFETIRKLAHRMKGSGGGFGFDALSELGLNLQNAADNKNAEEVQKQLDELISYLQRVEVVYEAEITA
ncbi:MAG: ATP-binding protein [bacterium]